MRDSNYDNFIPAEILHTEHYRDSSKQMSFTFREDDEEIHIFAFASLRGENLNGNNGGLKILSVKNDNYLFDERFFDRIKSIAEIWSKDGEFSFDYIWFNSLDIDANILQRLIIYIDFERLNDGLYMYRLNRDI